MTQEYPRAAVDGFELGIYASYGDCGDAWVRAPDGSAATLVWATGEPERFTVVIEPGGERWGTYDVQLPLPLTDDEEAAAYLAALLPELRSRWQARQGSGAETEHLPGDRFAGMTVVEALATAGLMGEWDAALATGGRQDAIDVLGRIGLGDQAATIVDTVLANPKTYGYGRRT